MDRPPPPQPPKESSHEGPLATHTPPSAPVVPGQEPHPDAVEWRLSVGDRQYGPTVTTLFAQWITAGRVPPEALVWRTGWPDWRTADSARADLPAPLPAASAKPTAPSASDAADPTVAYRRRREAAAQRSRWLAIVLAIACVTLGVVLVLAILGGPASEPAINQEQATPVEPPR